MAASGEYPAASNNGKETIDAPPARVEMAPLAKPAITTRAI
jgi:hypothetical protein